MVRQVFYSFHYGRDAWRVGQVRNIGFIEGNKVASDNDWEQIKRGGEQAIKNWIDNQMKGRSCCIVLIGTETANRPWINYEIIRAWNQGKAIFGINVHNLKNREGVQSPKGQNPFEYIALNNGVKLSSIIPVYDPPYFDSQNAYNYIANNIDNWIEKAIAYRR